MQSAVLVTGASTGIGAAIAATLAHNGYAVFAGVRNDDAATAIEAAHGDVRAIRLDVTEASGIPPEDVANVVLEALTSKKPRAQYLVGKDARVQAFLSRLPTHMTDALLRKAMKLP